MVMTIMAAAFSSSMKPYLNLHFALKNGGERETTNLSFKEANLALDCIST